MGIHKVKAFVCEEVYQSTPPVDLLPGERHPFGTVTTLSSLDNLEQVLSRGVTVSIIHRVGKRERSAAIDEPMKRLDPGSVLVRSLKDRHGTHGGL
jgi:hypothetical protein